MHYLTVYASACYIPATYERLVDRVNAGRGHKDSNMFAIIQTGGKQYSVEEGKTFKTEKIDGEVGAEVEFDALLVSDDDGSNTKVGNPTVPSAKVTGKIVEQGRDKKISVVKYKPKVRYRRNVGHRQPFTKVLIETIKA